MNKFIDFIKDFFIILYKIALIIYKIIAILIKRTYRYVKKCISGKKVDNPKVFKIRNRVIKVRYLIICGLVLLPVALSVVSWEDSSHFIGNNTINNVISNDLSDLEETKRLDKDIENFMRKWEIVGASLAIMKNNKLVYCKGYGYADKDENIPCDVKHIFRLASVSKLITAVAIMRLVEQGKLKLSSKVFGEDGIFNEARFLNIKDRQVKNITVEHLLRHNSGFSTRSGDPMFNQSMISYRLNKKAPFTMDDIVEYASQSSLRFKPGTSTNYSNLGYVVLTKLIEKITGRDYEKYVKDEIFAPIGCFDIHIANNNSKDKYKNEVRYYEPSDEVQFEDEDGNLIPKSDGGNDVRLLSGAGGWVGSPAEILKFVASIDGRPGVKDILSQRSIDYMTRNSGGMLPIGWIRTSKSEWVRTGSMAGTSAIIKSHSSGYTWMFVTNTSSWQGSRFTNQINSSFRKAFQRVDEWPKRDIFKIADSITGRI